MITDNLQNEFWFHVSPQSAMPIAGSVPPFIDTNSLQNLIEQFNDDSLITEDNIKTVIRDRIDNIDILRALVGISDKRMYLDLSYIFYKQKYNENDNINILSQNLYNVNSHPLKFFKDKILVEDERLAHEALNIITNYLTEHGIVDILNSLKLIGTEASHILIEKLINAKEAQQKLTKRRGHGIEQALAIFLDNINIEYLPEDRDTNPMSRDPNVLKSTYELSPKIQGQTWAFDLIIQKEEANHIFIQGLIHTSDPGQYGVNKSDETVTIKNELSQYNTEHHSSKELWGLVDGVGFTENKTNTIDKMLCEFDTFIQLNTMYKAALKLHILGLTVIRAIQFNPSIYTEEEARAMYNKYASNDIEFLYSDIEDENTIYINGGNALIIM